MSLYRVSWRVLTIPRVTWCHGAIDSAPPLRQRALLASLLLSLFNRCLAVMENLRIPTSSRHAIPVSFKMLEASPGAQNLKRRTYRSIPPLLLSVNRHRTNRRRQFAHGSSPEHFILL